MRSTYKGKVTHRSWQHLPQELVRLIVTHALLDISANAYVPKSWEQRDQWLPRMVFNVVRDTDYMENFMNVCPPWFAALETHLFWAQAAAVLDPLDALLSLQRTPTRFSPYNHFRYNILNRCCVPCRVNAPHTSTGLWTAKRTAYTYVLGSVPVCRDHVKDRFCGICLRDATDESVLENEDGETWSGIDATCRSCRAEWLLRNCDSPREREALGGRSLRSVDWETRQAVDTFVEASEGTIREVRSLALERHWLRRNTKIAEMLNHAVAASRYATREEAAHSRTSYTYVDGDNDDDLSDADPDLDNADTDDADADDADLLGITEDAGGVRDLAINDWARNRILDGHWYSPADQWQAMLQSPMSQSAEAISTAVPAIHPCPWNLPPEEQTDAEARPHPSPTMVRCDVPPSFPLCTAAYEAFKRQLRAVLFPAMRNIVRKIVIECAVDGVDPCIKAARYDVEDVARELRDVGVWYNGMDWVTRRQNGERERTERERAKEEREREERRRREREERNEQRRERKEESVTDDSSSEGKSDASHTTSPVLSASTLQTTPSPPPLVLKKGDTDEAQVLPSPTSPTTLTFPIAISPVLDSPTLIPSIPYVPVTMAQLPPLSIDAFKAVWREACAPLFQCRCTICERAVQKANIEAGSTLVPTTDVSQGQQGQYAPPTTAPPPPLAPAIQVVHLEPAVNRREEEEEEEEDDDDLLVSPLGYTSDGDDSTNGDGELDRGPRGKTGRKRSSEELEYGEEEEEDYDDHDDDEDGDENPFLTRSRANFRRSRSRSRTPPKRPRTDAYERRHRSTGDSVAAVTKANAPSNHEDEDEEETWIPVRKQKLQPASVGGGGGGGKANAPSPTSDNLDASAPPSPSAVRMHKRRSEELNDDGEEEEEEEWVPERKQKPQAASGGGGRKVIRPPSPMSDLDVSAPPSPSAVRMHKRRSEELNDEEEEEETWIPERKQKPQPASGGGSGAKKRARKDEDKDVSVGGGGGESAPSPPTTATSASPSEEGEFQLHFVASTTTSGKLPVTPKKGVAAAGIPMTQLRQRVADRSPGGAGAAKEGGLYVLDETAMEAIVSR